MRRVLLRKKLPRWPSPPTHTAAYPSPLNALLLPAVCSYINDLLARLDMLRTWYKVRLARPALGMARGARSGVRDAACFGVCSLAS